VEETGESAIPDVAPDALLAPAGTRGVIVNVGQVPLGTPQLAEFKLENRGDTPLTLVRVNVTTRTAVQRSEYSTTGNTLAYKEQTQSLMLLPRHFGLNF